MIPFDPCPPGFLVGLVVFGAALGAAFTGGMMGMLWWFF